MMKANQVYHSSQMKGLEAIQPQQSSHGEDWIYATKDIVTAAAFLGTEGGDFTCTVGRDPDSGMPFICERFQGAFDLRYQEVEGSIYVLPADTFVEGKTQWAEEVVSRQAVEPVREIRVDDAKEYLLGLAQEGKLRIAFYPDKIAYVPEDDQDLVYRAALWHKQFGGGILARIKKYHPNLLPRVKKAIEN